ncbi:MAG: prenyltransferase [Cyclobacteriaceae bacterium]|nr:MAG: prenyltransferase [Cyclobacteriaceae bacterium]
MSTAPAPVTAETRFSIPGVLKLVRWPNLLMIAVSQYLAAIFLLGPAANYGRYLKDLNLLLICVGTVSIAAAGYIINDYYDVKIDYINKPERVIVGNILKRRVAMFIHIGLNLIGLICGALVSLKIASINLLAATWLWGYSNQLKRMPLIGNFSVAILSALAIAIVGIHYGAADNLIYIYAIFAFVVSLIREIVKDLEDLKGDETFGCKTLPVVWGIRPTKSLIFVLMFLFALLLINMLKEIDNNNIYLYFAAMFLPAVYFIYRLWIADTRKHFHQLSTYLKLFMASGILSMILA